MALTKITGEGVGAIDSLEITGSSTTTYDATAVGGQATSGTLTIQNTHNNANVFAAIDFNTNNNRVVNRIVSGHGDTTSNGFLAFVTEGSGTPAERMRIGSDGEVTMPSQPAFLVKPASQQTNVNGDTNVTVVMDNEIFDVGANFASNTFTAPITGKYFLSFVLYGVALPGTANYLEIAVTTSNRGYVNIQEPSGSEDVYAGGTVSCIADMDANDTAFARVTIGGSSSQFDIGTTSTFSGALIC